MFMRNMPLRRWLRARMRVYFMRMENGYGNSDGYVRELLAGLSSSAPGSAWREFLQRYSQTIMLIATKGEGRNHDINDCYLFVCEKLSDNGFARLKRYDLNGSASFRSWLNVVVANLCIDWRRRRDGRYRPFKSIGRLPQLEQCVFKYRIQQRLSLNACIAVLKPQFPDLTELQLARAAQRVNLALTSRQQWLLSTQSPRFVAIDGGRNDPDSIEPRDATPDPELACIEEERHDRLRRALDRLPAQQRLLLILRYRQDLSLKEIARLARLGDPYRARRKIQQALKQLEEFMQE